MSREYQSMRGLAGALRRARGGIFIIGVIYLLSVSAGMVMAHRGYPSAVRHRDAVVARARRSDPAAKADIAGQRGAAALLDFSRNLGLAAIPDTIGGMAFVLPIGAAAYRGWVGGIVAVDGHHRSRLIHRESAVYYLVTMALQLAGFILAGGAGLHLGWSLLHPRDPLLGPRWFRIPQPALVDVAWLYVLIVPLFALGSLWEYFAPRG